MAISAALFPSSQSRRGNSVEYNKTEVEYMQDSVLRTAKCPTSLSCEENLRTDLFIVNKVLCLALSVFVF